MNSRLRSQTSPARATGYQDFSEKSTTDKALVDYGNLSPDLWPREPDAEIIAIPATLRHNREGTVERRTSVHHEAAGRTSIVHRELQAPGGRLQIAPIHRYVVVTTIDERRDSPAIGEAAIGIEQITAVTGQGCVLRDSCVVHFVIASKQRDARRTTAATGCCVQ
ncbi:hypothetical protein ACVIGA_005726 [Bradyrhizobium sp. USDA 3240]